jgi:hypothetical protein
VHSRRHGCRIVRFLGRKLGGVSYEICGLKRRRTISCDGNRGQGRRSSCFQDWCSRCICTSCKSCSQKAVNRGRLHVEDSIKGMMRDRN